MIIIKKKLFAVLVSLILVTSLFPCTISAGTNLGYFPLNYTYRMTYEYGTPVFNFEAYNRIELPITGFEFVVYPKYSDGTDIYYGRYNYTTIPVYFNESEYLYMYDSFSGCLSLYDFVGASEYTQVRLDKVYFANGRVWQNSKPNYYEEASFDIGASTDAYGNYIVDPATHEVQLWDYSYSAYKYSWYIWNDAYGWVWFSDETDPICTIWTKSASIKLVINNNPNLFKIINFTIAEAPSFVIRCHRTGNVYNTLYSWYETFNIGRYQAAPYYFSLWDSSNSATIRSWYIYDNTTGEWVWFSNDRGPTFQVWGLGEHSIMLVHDNDFANSKIFDFEIAY